MSQPTNQTTTERDAVHGVPLGAATHEADSKDVTVIGPECFASADKKVICWQGRNYVAQSPAAEPSQEIEQAHADLEEVKAAVDHGQAQHNPQALKAVRVAETLLDIVERLTAEGVDAMADRFVEQTRIRSLEIRNGTTNLDLEPSQELVAVWVGAARTMLGNAQNYSEISIEIPTDTDPKASMEVKLAGESERYAFTLQRVGKLTPHQARMRAEQELADAQAQLANAERQLKDEREQAAPSGPWRAVLHDESGWIHGDPDESLRQIFTDEESGRITVCRGTAAPVDGAERMPGYYDDSDNFVEIDLADCATYEQGIQAWKRAQAATDGLNRIAAEEIST